MGTDDEQPVEIVEQWAEHGFVVLPGLLTAEDLAAGLAELSDLYPTAEEYHGGEGGDERRRRFSKGQFGGIDTFPFSSVELSLLAVHPKLIALSRTLLGDEDIQLYAGEAWAKYTGATDYDQLLHRDFINHTVLVPSDDPRYRQLELFLYLSDVPDDLGPPRLVPFDHTRSVGLFPNWHQRDAAPELYAEERSAAGPAGTVVAWSTATLHRGTNLRRPGGARYTIHLNLRRSEVQWAHRHGWASRSGEPAWTRFVARASVDQLRLFGFPRPGHPFWTDQTLQAMGVRYPGFRADEWRGPLA